MIILFLLQSLQAIGRARRESLWHGAAEKRLIKLKKALLAKCFLVGAGGFGPPKSLTTDLQSAPFGHSGTLPIIKPRTQNAQGFSGAGDRSRTNNLLITNQLLCH